MKEGLPKPHVYNSPELVMHAECELPHAISRMRFDFKASINFGLSKVILLLCPSAPSPHSPVLIHNVKKLFLNS